MTVRILSIDLEERERKEAGASRRFPVSISSTAPVKRRDFESGGALFDEVLSHSAGAVDLSRAPLPVIEGHDRSRTNLGIVTNLHLDGDRLRGELVLGASQRAQELAADIAEGIVTGLSVGYSVEKTVRDEKAKRTTATRWTPYEVSIVSVPADVSVGIGRSITMDPQNPTAVELATREERDRVNTIRVLVSKHSLGDALAEDLISRGVALDLARNVILDKIAARSEAYGIQNPHRETPLGGGERERPITSGNDYTPDFQRATVDAILMRSGIQVQKPHAAAGDVSASIYDIARTCLSRAGKSASRVFGGEMRGPELLKRAATTSDFPLILSGALHAAVRNGYETEPSSHRAWVRTTTVPDLRDQERPILGSAPALEKVLEGAEYKHGYMTEDSASYKVAKYGKIVALTWETLVNDRLGAFLRVQPALGQAARRLEADTVYALLAENGATGPTMQDGTVLFHADHDNLVGSAGFDATQLGAGRTLLRKMTALGGGHLSIVPKFLIVPAEKEQAAEILLTNATRRMTTEKSTPEWIASLQLVVEPRLASTSVYLAADSSQIDTCELGLLEENVGGPVIDEEQEFNRDEKRWKVRHVFGAKFLDWRGIVRLVVT